MFLFHAGFLDRCSCGPPLLRGGGVLFSARVLMARRGAHVISKFRQDQTEVRICILLSLMRLSLESTPTLTEMTLPTSTTTPPPSPLYTRVPSLVRSRSPSPIRASMPLKMADVANLFVKLRRAQHRSKYQMHAECSSGEGPLTHKCLLGDGAVSLRRVPLAQETAFVCRDGVDVVKLLRLVRATMFEDAQSIGADVLVDEQWSCRICGPRQDGRTFKVHIRYSASAARSGRRDPQKPVALEGAHGVPGLMTVLDRLD